MSAIFFLATAAVHARHAPRCSKAFLVGARTPDRIWFLGSALPDSMYAGPGDIQPQGSGPGHAGPAGPGAFLGQLVRVERLDPQASDDLRRGVEQSGGRVLLVPWDYDAGCQTVPRVARATWVEAGRSGLFSGRLRRPAHWRNGIPILDVLTPEFEPYPFPVDAWERDTSRQATAEELFAFVGDLPTRTGTFTTSAAWEEELEQRHLWLQAWAKEHPALAALPPIRGEIAVAKDGFLRRHASYRRIKSPIAGTWELRVVLEGSDTLRFYARTAETPIQAAYGIRGVILPEDAATRPPYSYDLMVKFARTLAELDSLHVLSDLATREGYFELVEKPVVEEADSTVWHASLPLISMAQWLLVRPPQGTAVHLAQAFRTGDTIQLARLRASGVPDRWIRLHHADSVRVSDRSPGDRFHTRVVRRKDGSMRSEEVVMLGGIRLVTLVAERIDSIRYPRERVPRKFP